jgi:predicted O-linked N-acetylglucosamine transferase (SPINDLY family)
MASGMLRRLLADALIAAGRRAERGGRLQRACGRYRAAAAVAPLHPAAHLNLGAALEAAGDAAAAERAYERLLAAKPADPYGNYNLGRLRQARGDRGHAERLLRRALDAKPDFAEALVLLAAILEAGGDLEGAQARLKAALDLQPGHGGTWYNYCEILWKLGRPLEAEAALRRALEADPAHAYANFHVGRLEYSRGNAPGAERLLRTAATLLPGFLNAQTLLADVLLSQERLDEAEQVLRRALQTDPRSVMAWYTLGLVLRGMARLGESLEALAAARRLAPERFDLEPTELLLLTLSDAFTADEVFERHRDYGARLEAAVAPRFSAWKGDRDPERRLRVGFVSCDLHRHPVAWFLLPLLERLDRARVATFCYAAGRKSDNVTAQVRAAADNWRDAAELNDEQFADAIHGDAIDVLVDLIGYAGSARLGVFARQPAPVQASWLGYLHSTGLTRIAYRLTDARADPPGTSERLHTESLVRLPHSLWCYRPPLALEHAPAPPCARSGHVTFGSFQLAPKLSPTVRRLWAEILRRLPQARLLLVGVPAGRAREDLLRDFGAAGIAHSRLTILPRLALDPYFRQYDNVDIALDTAPYGGGTTTFEALWMGVPVLTLAGDRSASRSAASILGALGLHAWIAATPEDYVRLALAHAGDREDLAALRTALRQRLQGSPLMDEARFARDMEAALRGMWRARCARPMS